MHYIVRSCVPWVMGLIATVPAVADEVRFDARALFDKAVTQDVRLAADGNSIELDRGDLIEDDGPAAGYSYKPNEERISGNTWIRKDLVIPDPRGAKATLLVGSGGALQAIVNGKPVELQKEGKAGAYWEAYPLPPELLVPGKNLVVLHGSGKVWIAREEDFAGGSRERTKHPNRSARSTDGGKTWDYERLGPDGNIDGEYYVRLFLDRYRPTGSITLQVLDMGNLAGRTVADPIFAPVPLTIRTEAEVGTAGRLSIRARAGPTPKPDKAWSAWQDVTARGMLERPIGRYVQVAVDLATADHLYSPKLKRVTVDASPERAGDWARSLRLIGQHNELIVRTSIPFEYEPLDHPRLKELRQRHGLDNVVSGATGEFDLITQLAVWSSKQWGKGHLSQTYPAWDAHEILKPHADGRPVGGFCQQYNLVFLQACESFGIHGRAVSLGPGGLVDKPRKGGHEVVELWSNEFRKWIYVDGEFAWYVVDQRTKVPLSLWELRARQLAILDGKPSEAIRIVKIAFGDSKEDWKSLEQGIPFGEMRMIPRSNFLAERSPLPLNQGMRGWFWTGHCVWTDDRLPAAALYGNRIRSRANWEWTLNQAHIVLEATEKPGELRVHLDTETPGFDTFIAEIDGKAGRPVASGFAWKLQPGENRLEVRPRNVAGREGITSWVVLDFQSP